MKSHAVYGRNNDRIKKEDDAIVSIPGCRRKNVVFIAPFVLSASLLPCPNNFLHPTVLGYIVFTGYARVPNKKKTKLLGENTLELN